MWAFLLLIFAFAWGEFPAGQNCINRINAEDCYGRPKNRLEWYFSGMNVKTYSPNVAGISRGSAAVCTPPDQCLGDNCVDLPNAQHDGIDGQNASWSYLLNGPNVYTVLLLNDGYILKTITLQWHVEGGLNPVPFTLSLYDKAQNQLFTKTFTTNPGNSIFTTTTDVTTKVTNITITAPGPIKIEEFYGYEDPAAMEEPCSAVEPRPADIEGPVVSVVFEKTDLPDSFKAIRWDQITHIFFASVTPASINSGSLGLDTCTDEYLSTLICWAHKKGVKVLIQVKGSDTEFSAVNIGTFSTNLLDLVVSRGLDGAEINWGWSNTNTAGTFSSLLAAVYPKLHGKGTPSHPLLQSYFFYF